MADVITVVNVTQSPSTLVRVTKQANYIAIPQVNQSVEVATNNIPVRVNPRTQVVSFTPPANFITIPGSVEIVTIGTQGPQGPPGTGVTQQAPAGVNITAFQLVCMISGSLYPADPTNPAYAPLVVGIATTSATSGHLVTYSSGGEIDGMTGLLAGNRYYAGLNGSLSLSVIAMGATWLKSLGQAKTTTQFIYTPNPSVLL